MMSFLDEKQKFANDVARKCFAVYKSLGKKGKPQVGREWTKMACIVKTDIKGAVEVLTLATGTKCIGANQRSKQGDLLNDSHAEVLARRLFLKYLYKQILLTKQVDSNNNNILSKCNNTGKFYVKEGTKIHLFSTDTPCGDASIFPKKVMTNKKRKLQQMEDTTQHTCCHDNNYTKPGKSQKVADNISNMIKNVDGSSSSNNEHESRVDYLKQDEMHEKDIYRTGAKCVPGGMQDLHHNGVGYHVTGALRIKPGRGDRTLSMSCSDKIMKWCVLGLQGGLLSNLLRDPVFLSTIIISDGPYSESAFKRALSSRGRCDDEELRTQLPVLYLASVKFEDSKERVIESGTGDGRITPAGTSILYCSYCDLHEVSANGRKHGITKKDLHTSKARTSICKQSLFEDFQQCNKMLGCDLMGSYSDCKHKRHDYVLKRKKFFQVFHDWIQKPD